MLLADQVAGEISGEHYTLFSSGSLWRNAQVGSAMASETVALLRALMQCDGWAAPMHETLTAALMNVPEVVRLLQADPTARQLTDSEMLPAAFQALGAFSVLGGNLPSLFVGCRVSVEVEGAQGQTSREQGLLVRWDGAEDSDALLLLDSQLSELRLLAVSTLQLLPIDELTLPPDSFRLSAKLMPCFEAFLPKRRADGGGRPEQLDASLQTSFLFGLLQTRALKALQGLLRDEASMRHVLDCGLLPSIMASAAMPVPLVGIHQTEVLQTHVAMLEQMHREASSAAVFAKNRARAAALEQTQVVRRATHHVVGAESMRPSARSSVTPRTSIDSSPVAPRSEVEDHRISDRAASQAAPTAPDLGLMAYADEKQLEQLQAQVAMLADMGFERTLCQKAVGMFGEDMDASVAWLTDDQAQQAQRTHASSPEWALAEELATMMGTFSVGACKKALDRTAQDLNNAAVFLLDHGAALEAEVEAEADELGEDGAEAGRIYSSTADEGAMPGGTADIDEEFLQKTVSFRPGAAGGPVRPQPVGSGAKSIERRTSGDKDSSLRNEPSSFDVGFDEFVSAAPPPPQLPEESSLAAASRAGVSVLLLSNTKAASSLAALPMPPLSEGFCLPGRLLRPVPLSANRNCVVHSSEKGGRVRLCYRALETDVMHSALRAIDGCQRPEASLAAHFPELRQLGANSSGLSAVSGAAHTTLAVLLLRQAMLFLLSDLQGLQKSHDDESSPFELEQLGRPRDLMDLLKLAYHSSGSSGAEALGSGAFAKLWRLMENLMAAESEATRLPGPFKHLPRLLRDDALGHLKRELKGTVTLQSEHPLKGTALSGRHCLHLPGAAQLAVQLDARSELNGSAHLRFCLDEAGRHEVARFEGVAAGRWQNLTSTGDTLWVHAGGETIKAKTEKRKLWGFRVRITAEGWMPPKAEAQTLDTPLAIGWQLLELLCEHRPHELLTNHTFLVLTRYMHSAASPHRAAAASLLLRLLKLPDSALPDGAADPRHDWPMTPVHSLLPYVEWHADHGAPGVAGLLPHEIQLYAELVAHAQLRAPVTLNAKSKTWLDGVTELCCATAYLLPKGGAPLDPLSLLPRRWLEALQHAGLDVLQLQNEWGAPTYGALVKFATKKIGGPKGELLCLSARSLPAPGSSGLLGGTTADAARTRFGLLQLFNQAVQTHFKYVFTGYTDRPHTLGAELATLRELIFPEVKTSCWTRMLDAAAPVHPPAWSKANPPPVVTVNRHRAARERSDRRGKMRNSIFAQLVQQLGDVDRGLLLRRDRCFKVKFAGEAADDYGGPYREVFTMLCSELQNEDVLPLLLQTPNGQHNAGSNRDRFIMQPAATSAEQLQWYELIGVLMAMSLLQKETTVSLSLCSVIWKQLVQQPTDAHDLAGFDEMVCNSLFRIEHIEDEGVDEELFSDLIFESFTTILSNNVEVEICEGGVNIDVTWDNRAQYCAAVRRVRLQEGRAQTHAMLRGLNSMLPVRLMTLFTWSEFELMTCGTPEVDIDNLRRHTRYGVSVNPKEDKHIGIMWQVLEGFNSEQRSQFLTFIWGRNRLPQTEEDWGDQCMKIHTLENANPDGHFPVSHTCFFSMEWPRYSSVEVARGKLLYAIANCTDMDMDNTVEGLANLAMTTNAGDDDDD